MCVSRCLCVCVCGRVGVGEDVFVCVCVRVGVARMRVCVFVRCLTCVEMQLSLPSARSLYSFFTPPLTHTHTRDGQKAIKSRRASAVRDAMRDVVSGVRRGSARTYILI